MDSNKLPRDGEDLVKRTRRTIEELRAVANEHDKLYLLNGSQELVAQIRDVLKDINDQNDKILETIHSESVYNKLSTLLDSVNNISVFFEEVKGTKFIYLAKGKNSQVKVH
jgi:hypothetical protein